jgi:UMP-CMP kinase
VLATPRGGTSPLAAAATYALSGNLSARSSDTQARVGLGGAPYEVTMPRWTTEKKEKQLLPEAMPTVIVMGGPPGCGKTTNCERIAKHFHYIRLSVADLMQEEQNRDVSDGNALPEFKISVLKKAMEHNWKKGKYIIDDFPMDARHWQAFMDILMDKVYFKYCLYLDCAEEARQKRLQMFECAEDIQRDYAAFSQEAGLVIHMLRYEGRFRRVDCNREPEKVWAEIQQMFLVQEHRDAMSSEIVHQTPAKALWSLRDKQSEEIFPTEHSHTSTSIVKAPLGFSSYTILARHREKHTRNMHAPVDNYHLPATLSQEIGWHSGVGEGNLIGAKGIPVGGSTPRVFHPKNTCSMTRHMENMYSTNAQNIIRR